MERRDRALRGTAATPEMWGAVYMMIVFALVARGLHAWEKLAGKPLSWQDAIALGVDLLICPAPLLTGIAFQRLLKSEVSRGLLSQRTYKICNFWIAQLLILAYIALVL